MRGLLVALTVSVGLGCYTYQPLGESVPEPGAEIRAHLSPTQTFDVGTVTVDGINRIEGVVYEASQDTVALWGQWLYSPFGRYDPRGAVFYVDRAKVPMLETRRLRPFQSIVAVAVGVGIGYGLFTFVADPGSSSTEGPGGGPIEVHLVPIR